MAPQTNAHHRAVRPAIEHHTSNTDTNDLPAHEAAATPLPGRTVHLVDLENLLGDPRANGPIVGRAAEQYLHIAGYRKGDLVYVAANTRLAVELENQRSVPARVRGAHGKDGADLVLLGLAPEDFIVRRADRLVIGSGDHIFLERALKVREHGIEVDVVSSPESLNYRYRVHGFRVLPYDRTALAA